MTSSKRIAVVFGTRPEAIKLAPLVNALQGDGRFTQKVVVTAQHREMLDQVLTLFGIVPDVDLDIIQPRQSLTDVTVNALRGLSGVIADLEADAVVVQGDTTTTFAGALAAFYAQVPVVHLEAGLRTQNRYSPFPEEINRRMTTQLTSLHLPPTDTARRALLREGVDPASIVVTGNTVIDALFDAIGRSTGYGDPALDRLDTDDRRVLLVTAHRRESWGEPMAAVGRAVATLARDIPDVLVVLPAHRNPVVREALLPALEGCDNVIVTEPVAYEGFVRLLGRSHVILTDSGGVQEEGPSLGKPVLVMRDSTERPEAVDSGTVRLVGTDEAAIVREVRRLFDDPVAYEEMATAVNPYGDGKAADRTVAAIAEMLGVGERIGDFTA